MPESLMHSLETFLEFVRTMGSAIMDLFVNIWQNGFSGVSLTRLFLAILVFALAYFVRHVFAHSILGMIQKWTKKTNFTFDDMMVKIVRRPLSLFPIILGVYLAITIMQPVDILKAFSEKILRTIMVYAIFISLIGLVDPVIDHSKLILEKVKLPVRIFLKRALKISLFIIGGSIVLELWGVRIATLLAGLGIVGAALALAAQDLIRNLISGILIILEKRFQPGEWIRVEGIVEGVVEDIHFRSTRIRRFDKAPVFVPNAKLSDNAVINFSRMTHRRIYWLIGVQYKTSTEQLHYIRDAILNYILNHNDFAKPPEVATFVRVNRFSPSSIDFMLYCFTKTTNWGEWLAIKEALAVRIKEIVEEEAKTALALPAIQLYQDEDVEVFTPPEKKQKTSIKNTEEENQPKDT